MSEPDEGYAGIAEAEPWPRWVSFVGAGAVGFLIGGLLLNVQLSSYEPNGTLTLLSWGLIALGGMVLQAGLIASALSSSR